MSALGQKRTFEHFRVMSALPPKADISQRDWATCYFGSQIRHMIRRFLNWGRPMSALALSCLIFMLTLGGIFLGALLRRALPEHHLSKDSQDVVRLGTGLIGTIAALVLGLLIAAAKSSFDTQSTQVTQITADIILLDNLLAQYGPEARPIREQMRSIIGPVTDQIRREKQSSGHSNSTLRGKRLISRSKRFPRRTISSAHFRPGRGSSAPIWYKLASFYLRSRAT